MAETQTGEGDNRPAPPVGHVVTGRLGGWRIRSAEYIAERHGLVVILAIGESLLALGCGAAIQTADTALVVAGVLGIANAIALWWLY